VKDRSQFGKIEAKDLFADVLREFYNKLNLASGKRLDIITNTIVSFSKARAAQAAASMAYYAFFSLFPLLLVFIAIGSFFLESDRIYAKIMELIGDAFPVSQQLIYDTLQRVISGRGPMGLIGLLGLLWAASGVFTTLTQNINLAHTNARNRNFIQARLHGLGMIVALCMLFILSLVLDASTNVLASWRIPLLPNISIYETKLWAWISNYIPWLLTFGLFIVLYRWVPTVRAAWQAVFWAAAVAATGWKLATDLFAWYLVRGLVRYELVYGSLGTVVALLFLIYVIGLVVLFGAHLCAAIDLWLSMRSSSADKSYLER
jgi:YihY family inner membrane protein